MNISIDLRLSRLGFVAPFGDSILPSFEDTTGLGNWTDLVDEKNPGIPGSIVDQIDKTYFQTGLRPCDSYLTVTGHKEPVPLWRIAVPSSIDNGLRLRQQKGIKRSTVRGTNVQRIEVSPKTFWEIIKQVSQNLHQISGKSFKKDLKLCDSADQETDLYGLMEEFHSARYGSREYRTWSRFIKFFFCRGHKHGPIEQAITAVHLNTLQFTDFSHGFYQISQSSAAAIMLLSIMSPDTFVKSFKKFTSRIEDDLFEYIGSDPSIPEQIDPVVEGVLNEYFHHDKFSVIWKSIESREDYELTLKWIEDFCPTRNLPKPDDVSVVDVYEEYLGYLTTTDHIGVRVTARESYDFIHGGAGRHLDDFLSRVIAGQIIDKSLKGDKRSASALMGTSTPIEKLSTSSTLDYTRKKFGHYGEIAGVMKDFLMQPIDVVFPYLMTGDDGTFVSDDYGNKLCPAEHGALSVWQIAYLTEPCCQEKSKLFKPNANTVGGYYGLDQRFGSLIFLYGAYTCRPWIESMDAYVEATGCLFETEAQVRVAVERGDLKVPSMRTVPVLEPGGKVRWVSASSGALTYFQIAFAEDLRDLYTNVEGARVGLASDHHLFRFEQAFADHSLDKILRPEGRLGLTPESVREASKKFESAELPVEENPAFQAEVLFSVANSVAQAFSTSVAAAIVSTLPLGKALQDSLFEIMKEAEIADPALGLRIGRIDNYREWEASILSSPLKEEVITCQTSDMVKATDTFRHEHHHRNLSRVLRNLGFDVGEPCRDTG